MEMKKVAESLRNRLFDVIKNILPNAEKEMRLRSRLRKCLWDTLEHISRLPGIGREVDDLLNIHPWPTALSKDAMRRIYIIIAEFARDVPTRWVYIRRDYRLENEDVPQPGAGVRVVKNADVKIVNSSCKKPCQNPLGFESCRSNKYDSSGNCFLNKKPSKVETAESFSTDEEDDLQKAAPSSTSTPKEAPKDNPRADRGQAGPSQTVGTVQTIIRHAGGYLNKDPAKHSPPDPSKALMIEKYIEKCSNMKTETESRSLAIKQEKILAIKRAQTSAKRRRKMNKAKPEVAAWIKSHLEQQKGKIARFNEKKENRAKPNGKRYIPALDNKIDSSETYDSDSEDSVPEVLWNPQKPWAPPGPRNLDTDQAPKGSTKVHQRAN